MGVSKNARARLEDTMTFLDHIAESERLWAADANLPPSVRARLRGRASAFAVRATQAEAAADDFAAIQTRSFRKAAKAWLAAAGAGGASVFVPMERHLAAGSLEALAASLDEAHDAAWSAECDRNGRVAFPILGTLELRGPDHGRHPDDPWDGTTPPKTWTAWKAQPLTGLRWESCAGTVVDLVRDGDVWTVTATAFDGRVHVGRTSAAYRALLVSS